MKNKFHRIVKLTLMSLHQMYMKERFRFSDLTVFPCVLQFLMRDSKVSFHYYSGRSADMGTREAFEEYMSSERQRSSVKRNSDAFAVGGGLLSKGLGDERVFNTGDNAKNRMILDGL